MADRTHSPLLLVEDDENLGTTLTERLRSSGHPVVWAQSLRQARRELGLQRFALALLDVGLPDGSGFELGGEIQRQWPSTAMIFLTALGDAHHRIHGLGLGAEDYVVKPFHFQELLLRIDNGLRRHRHWDSVPDEVEVGQARIQFGSLSAERDGQSTVLSPREAALLRFLVARRGSVVTRDEILDEVWARDEYPTPRTIDNFIMKLRRLVEPDIENPTVIRTVWGVGYQLQSPPAARA